MIIALNLIHNFARDIQRKRIYYYYCYFILLDLLLPGETRQCKHCFSRVPRGQTKKHQNSITQVHENTIRNTY